MKLGELLPLLRGDSKIYLHEWREGYLFAKELLGASHSSPVFEHYKEREIIGITISSDKNFCITVDK